MTSAPGIPRASRTPVSGLLGAALGVGFAAAQGLRHPRPIHSRGVVLSGVVRRIPGARPAGISWIDDAPDDARPVVARVSRSVGLPAPFPDILGLALRVDDADIEFASTGWHVPGRFALLPRRSAERASFGILLPYRGAHGPVLLGARTVDGGPPATDPRTLRGPDVSRIWKLTLFHASPRGPWHPFALLELGLDPDQDDRGLRFDAVRRPLPGAQAYSWVRAARQPSYLRVQRAAPAPRHADAAPAPRHAAENPAPAGTEDTETSSR